MIPGFNNMLIMLIKGSALAGFIFLQDLTFVTEQLRRTLDTFTAFGLGLVIYFLISLICSYILRWMELRAQRRLGLKEARKPRTDKARSEERRVGKECRERGARADERGCDEAGGSG